MLPARLEGAAGKHGLALPSGNSGPKTAAERLRGQVRVRAATGGGGSYPGVSSSVYGAVTRAAPPGWTLSRPRAPEPRLGGPWGGRGEQDWGVRTLVARQGDAAPRQACVADCSCGRDSEVSAVSPAALSVPGQARLLRSAGRPVAACARPLGARWWAAGACDRRPPWARWGFSVAVSDTGQASVWGALTSGSVGLSFTQPAGCSAPHFPGVLSLQLLGGRTPASAGLSAVLPLRLRAVL